MEKQRIENYKKWFDRWIKNYDLKKQIEIANNKNYTRLNIPVHNIKDERDKNMMLDNKFTSMLENEFIGFKIIREKEVKDRYFLGNKRGQVELNTVYIDWSQLVTQYVYYVKQERVKVVGFFMKLGNELDGLIWDTREWIKKKHLTSFYYKWYAYHRFPQYLENPNYIKYLDHFYKMGQIYKWQYEKLKNLKED